MGKYQEILSPKAKEALAKQDIYDELMNIYGNNDDDGVPDIDPFGWDGDFDKDQPPNPQDITLQYPGYPWGQPMMENTMAYTAGTRKKDPKIYFYTKRNILLEPAIKYFKNLRWDVNENSPGVTFLELSLDFEIISGLTITHGKSGKSTTWNEKATIMRTFYKAYLKTYPQAEEIPQSPRIKIFSMFGASQGQSGLTVRPRFLGQHQTEKAIINNMVQFTKNNPAKTTSTLGVIKHQVDYTNCKVAHIMLDDLARDFIEQIQ